MGTTASAVYPPTKSCPICSGTGYHLFRTFHACACGVVFQDHRNLNAAVYDGAYHRKYVNPKCEAAYLKAANLYLPLIGRLTRGRRMLEIGAAVDVTMRAFQQAGWQVTGSDINTHIDSQVPMIAGDFEHVAIEEKYDCIWASHVIEHFADPRSALAKMHSLLSGNGVLFLATPDAGQLDFYLPPAWGHLHEKEHHVLFSLARFLDVAAEVGFVPVRLRVNTSPAAGFIGWADFHTVLVKPSHAVAGRGCLFPELPDPPPMPELVRCTWREQEYELLPFDVHDGAFWLQESERRGIALEDQGSNKNVRLENVRREPFEFYRSPTHDLRRAIAPLVPCARALHSDF